MRKNLIPGEEKRITQVVFDSFSRGTIQDPPASEIKNAISDSENITAFDNYYEGRTGCVPYGIPVPPISGRTGYSAYKSGRNIVSLSGEVFSHQDVGNYFSWGNYYELITDFVDEETVIGSDEVYRSGDNCAMIGMPNFILFHKILRYWVMMTGGNIIYSDVEMSEWKTVFCISGESPCGMKSDFFPYNDDIIVFNSRGMFRAKINTAFPVVYKININPPGIKLEGIEDFNEAKHSYNYLYSCTRIDADGNFVDIQSGVVVDIETGTNLPDETDVDYAVVHSENEISLAHPHLLSTLWIPKVELFGDDYIRHITHFTIWRTEDLESKDIDDVNKELYNDPNRFVRAKDLRICAAFYGTISSGMITLLAGEFEEADRYSVLELIDGRRTEITEILDSKHAFLDTDYSYDDFDYTGAAVLGYGRIFEGTIINGVFTRTAGDNVYAEDAGKTLWSSDGIRLYIISVIDENTARVHQNISQTLQGYTMDATHRVFCDTVEDTMIHARKDFYTCYSRYRRPLPDCNIGTVITNYVVCAARGRSKIYYSHFEYAKSQLIGQYIPNLQTTESIKDDIQLFCIFGSVLSVVCSNSTWGTTIGISELATLPSSTEAIAIMPGFKVVDDNRGCIDIDSATETENGAVALVTNEPGGESLRLLNCAGYSSDDYLVDNEYGGRITKKMSKTMKKSMAIYDWLLGLVLWRKNREE